MRGAALALAALLLAGGARADEEAIARGAYLARAGGCHACHTDHAAGGASLAGGGRVATPFGSLFAPNITPDREHGIGRWSQAEFATAMRHGQAPSGESYYPGFPYTAYSGIVDGDLADLWAYLQAQAPVAQPSAPHALTFPFDQRIASWTWQLIFFEPQPFVADANRDKAWNRGRYLAEHLLHCRECHTPRTLLGGLDDDLAYAGNRDWPAGGTVPNITSDTATGIGSWNANDIVWLLKTGFNPDGNDVQGSMAELIEHGASHLEDADLEAVAAYILSLDAIAYEVRRETSD